jgi:hypothetical protein
VQLVVEFVRDILHKCLECRLVDEQISIALLVADLVEGRLAGMIATVFLWRLAQVWLVLACLGDDLFSAADWLVCRTCS